MIDVVGTGGDRAHTINVSTISAARGRRRRRAGVQARQPGGVVRLRRRRPARGPRRRHRARARPAWRRCVAEAGIGFCFAPRYHPAMRHAGPSRRDLGIPTAFNILGPLSNPGRVKRYLIGVADLRMAERMAGVLARQGRRAGADRPRRRRPRRAHHHRPVHRGRAARRRRSAPGTSTPRRSACAGSTARTWWAATPPSTPTSPAGCWPGSTAPTATSSASTPAPAWWSPAWPTTCRAGIEAAREAIDSGAAVAALAALVEVSQREAAAEGVTRRSRG